MRKNLLKIWLACIVSTLSYSMVEAQGVSSVNGITGDVNIGLLLNNNDLSITRGDTVTLPLYGSGSISEIVTGNGLIGGGTSSTITIDAQNASALWNANKLQELDISNITPADGQLLGWDEALQLWIPKNDSIGDNQIFWSLTNSDTSIFVNITGFVGIGTNSFEPDAKLTVNGKIHTKELLVDLKVPGPDYVFEEGYNLMNLSDLEKFVVLHKHLPEIPSAKEMKANGIGLSEMNMLILKKVEELTLYVINHEKRIDKLESGNNK